MPSSPFPSGPSSRPVHPLIERTAAYAWRLVGIGLVIAGLVWLLGQLLVVVVPILVGGLLARALDPASRRLMERGLKPALAATTAVVGLLVAVIGVLGLVGATVADELDDLGPTLSRGLADVKDWLVEDSPFDVSRTDIDRWAADASDAASAFLRSGDGRLLSGALAAVEVLLGTILSLIVAFFVLKDGRRLVGHVSGSAAATRQPGVESVIGRGWEAAGAYLRGAALLGVVEAIAIGAALFTAGAELVAPVMVITFLAAFVPIVGASAAGVIAVLVALATAGPVAAAIVAAVVLVVQQLDNDLLAPVIYGRALRLHPLVILLGIASGGALFGIVGTIFAVPVLAVGLNAVDEARVVTRTRRLEQAGDQFRS